MPTITLTDEDLAALNAALAVVLENDAELVGNDLMTAADHCEGEAGPQLLRALGRAPLTPPDAGDDESDA